MIKVAWRGDVACLCGKNSKGESFTLSAKDIRSVRRSGHDTWIVVHNGPMIVTEAPYTAVDGAWAEAKAKRPPLCDFTASEFEDLGLDEHVVESCLREWDADIYDKMRNWGYDLVRYKLRDELGDPGATGAVGNDSPLPLHSPGGGHLYGGEEDGA